MPSPFVEVRKIKRFSFGSNTGLLKAIGFHKTPSITFLFYLMSQQQSYTKTQTILLVLFRYLIGWHILYEGIAKAINPQWSSLGFLQESQGVLSGLAQWIISNPDILSVTDFLNIWGLILIGAALLFGFFTKPAAMTGALLILIYYLNAVPVIGSQYTSSIDGNYLFVNKTLIESVGLCILAVFPTSGAFGFDGWINRIIKHKILSKNGN